MRRMSAPACATQMNYSQLRAALKYEEEAFSQHVARDDEVWSGRIIRRPPVEEVGSSLQGVQDDHVLTGKVEVDDRT